MKITMPNDIHNENRVQKITMAFAETTQKPRLVCMYVCMYVIFYLYVPILFWRYCGEHNRAGYQAPKAYTEIDRYRVNWMSVEHDSDNTPLSRGYWRYSQYFNQRIVRINAGSRKLEARSGQHVSSAAALPWILVNFRMRVHWTSGIQEVFFQDSHPYH